MCIAFGKLDHAKTGDTLSTGKQPHPALVSTQPQPAVLANALSAKDRKDDVKLSAALAKASDEDPSLRVEQNPETAARPGRAPARTTPRPQRHPRPAADR